MMIFQSWGEALNNSFFNVADGVVSFLPMLILALIIFAIGWILAILIERLVESIFKTLKVDSLLKSGGFEEIVKRSGYSLNSGHFVGVLVKWFVIIVFLMASFEVLGLVQVNEFLHQVVVYLPNVIIAVLILMVAAVVGGAMEKIVVASSRASNIHSAELLGRLTRWAIWIFAILTALITMGIAPFLTQLITAIVAGAALAFGLAFGLGGKEVAQKILEKATKNIVD